MKRTLAWALLACLLAALPALLPHPRYAQAVAEEDWRADFDDICARTQDAMALSPEELKGLVERCDRLKPRIEKLDESASKVFLKRLQMCRDLYAFVLESKTAKPQP